MLLNNKYSLDETSFFHNNFSVDNYDFPGNSDDFFNNDDYFSYDNNDFSGDSRYF
ncbi:1030_t:CDS:2 [Dentiscutata heterogama]|uniref:1030_t:CDS:1 n=1 Tax=Dentiscutata heterogama TaxID=1316150 RepID=A0ACA9K1D8_9GLOM|nr:1030_t:CDS:2 [Dentiscutata heterogama]